MAEIRNIIYDFVAGDPLSKDTNEIKLRHVGPPATVEFAAQNRQGLGLMQNCRQFREEFAPARMIIPLKYLAFVSKSIKITALPVGDVQIRFHEPGPFYGLTDFININELLSLCVRSSKLKLVFENCDLAGKKDTRKYLQVLFGLHENGKWRDCFQRSVANVFVVNFHARTRAVIEVRESDAEWWMVSRKKVHWAQMKAWLVKMGLGGISEWRGLRVWKEPLTR
jgi:hypothetical protein